MKKIFTSLIGICFAFCLMLLPVQAITAKAANAFSIQKNTTAAAAPASVSKMPRFALQTGKTVVKNYTAGVQAHALNAAAGLAFNQSSFGLEIALTGKSFDYRELAPPDSARNYGDRYFDLPPNLPDFIFSDRNCTKRRVNLQIRV